MNECRGMSYGIAHLHSLRASDFKWGRGAEGCGRQRPLKRHRVFHRECKCINCLWDLTNLHQWQISCGKQWVQLRIWGVTDPLTQSKVRFQVQGELHRVVITKHPISDEIYLRWGIYTNRHGNGCHLFKLVPYSLYKNVNSIIIFTDGELSGCGSGPLSITTVNFFVYK